MNLEDPIIYVIDDEAPIRDSLAMLLRSVGLASTVFADAPTFLAAAPWQQHACVIADVRMPGMSGLELQEALRTRGSALPVIIVTGHGDIGMAVRAMKNGAADFIEKPFNGQLLLDAVHRALALAAAPPVQASAAAEGDHDELERRISSLSPREHEVMTLVAQGLPNKSVATRLDLSTRTVEVHRARVMEKMGARSLAELVRMNIAAGLLKP
ncbi:MAG: response regulator [Casimicrobiaceae bacterium]